MSNPKPIAITELVKYQFNHDELHAKGLQLARLSSEQQQLEDDKKASASDYKAKIDSKGAEINLVSKHLNEGFEYRRVDCECRYNDPNTGMKSIYRKDNGELVRRESMTPEELQMELEFH